MRRLWDTLAGLLLSAFLLYFMVDMIRPYAGYIVAAAFLMFIGSRVIRRHTDW